MSLSAVAFSWNSGLGILPSVGTRSNTERSQVRCSFTQTVLLQLYFTVDIDTFAWYKEAIRGRVKSLILLMLNSLRDNPPLGTISSHKFNAIDGVLRELISLARSIPAAVASIELEAA